MLEYCNEINIEYLKESISDDFGFIFLIIFLSLNSRQQLRQLNN